MDRRRYCGIACEGKFREGEPAIAAEIVDSHVHEVARQTPCLVEQEFELGWPWQVALLIVADLEVEGHSPPFKVIERPADAFCAGLCPLRSAR